MPKSSPTKNLAVELARRRVEEGPGRDLGAQAATLITDLHSRIVDTLVEVGGVTRADAQLAATEAIAGILAAMARGADALLAALPATAAAAAKATRH